jgi:hypothetical protein
VLRRRRADGNGVDSRIANERRYVCHNSRTRNEVRGRHSASVVDVAERDDVDVLVAS